MDHSKYQGNNGNDNNENNDDVSVGGDFINITVETSWWTRRK